MCRNVCRSALLMKPELSTSSPSGAEGAETFTTRTSRRGSVPKQQRCPASNLLRKAEGLSEHKWNKSPLCKPAMNFPGMYGASPSCWSPLDSHCRWQDPHLSLHDHPWWKWRLARNRYPTGKVYWNSTAAHRGHREWVTVWQHYQQWAAPPTLPESSTRDTIRKNPLLAHDYRLQVLGTLRDGNIANVNGVRLASCQYEL
jgi:hypothetical protein